jgi:hypothetical protein
MPVGAGLFCRARGSPDRQVVTVLAADVHRCASFPWADAVAERLRLKSNLRVFQQQLAQRLVDKGPVLGSDSVSDLAQRHEGPTGIDGGIPIGLADLGRHVGRHDFLHDVARMRSVLQIRPWSRICTVSTCDNQSSEFGSRDAGR